MRWRKVLSPLGRPVRAVICTRANRRLVRGAALSPKAAALRFPQCLPFFFFFCLLLHFTSLHFTFYQTLSGFLSVVPAFLDLHPCVHLHEKLLSGAHLDWKKPRLSKMHISYFLGFRTAAKMSRELAFMFHLLDDQCSSLPLNLLEAAAHCMGNVWKMVLTSFQQTRKLLAFSHNDWFPLKAKFLPSSACLRCFDTTEELFSPPTNSSSNSKPPQPMWCLLLCPKCL